MIEKYRVLYFKDYVLNGKVLVLWHRLQKYLSDNCYLASSAKASLLALYLTSYQLSSDVIITSSLRPDRAG